MLTLLLVWTVALGSLAIFVAGMIFPELSRKNDLIWVGVGLLYALLLFTNKGQMGAGLVLGQTAGVSMMVWLGLQTMTQRRELTADDKKTPVPDWLQKIVDVVVPLWEKAYGAIAAQLGMETDAPAETESSENALDGFKGKILGFLDKLNNTPAETETDTIASEASDGDDDKDWGEEEAETPAEEAEASTEEIETTAETANEPVIAETAAVAEEEAVPEEEAEASVPKEASSEDNSGSTNEPEAEDTPQESPVEEESPTAEVSEEAVAEELPTTNPPESETSPENSNTLEDSPAPIEATSEIVAEETDTNEAENTDDDATETEETYPDGVSALTSEQLKDMAKELTPTTTTPEAEEETTESTPPAEQALDSPSEPQTEPAEPETTSTPVEETVHAAAAAEPLNSGTEESTPALEEEQEESNWPPEPMD